MALDVRQEESTIIGELINDVEKSLGAALASRVFASSRPGFSPTQASPRSQGTVPSTIPRDPGGEILLLSTSARFVSDTLMSLVEDGILDLSEPTVVLIGDVLDVRDKAITKLGAFTPGTTVPQTVFDDIDGLLEEFGELLKAARESAILVLASPQQAGASDEGGVTDDSTAVGDEGDAGGDDGMGATADAGDGGDVGEAETDEAETDEAEADEAEADDEAEVDEADEAEVDEADEAEVDETETEAEVVEDTATTLAQAVVFGQEALDELQLVAADLMALNFVQSSVGTVELIDSVDFMAMRTEVLKEIDALNDELVDMLTSGVASPDAMKTTSENALSALAERVEIIDALKASAADDADESEGDDDDGDVGEAEVEPEVDEAEVDEADEAEVDEADEAEVDETETEAEVVEDTATTLAQAVVFGQEALDELQLVAADLMALNFVQSSVGTVELIDSVDFMAMRTEVLKEIDALNDELVDMLTSGVASPDAMKTTSENALLALAERVEIIDALKASAADDADESEGDDDDGDVGEAEVEPEVDEAEVDEADEAEVDEADEAEVDETETEAEVVEDTATTLAQAVVFGQEALDELQLVAADLMALNFVQSSVGTVELIDSVDFMAMRTEVLKEIDALNDELVDMLTSGVASPDAMKTTSENALSALAERVEIIDALKASAADDADESEGDDDDGDVGEAEVEPEVDEAEVDEADEAEVDEADEAEVDETETEAEVVEDTATTLAQAVVFGQEALDELQLVAADLMALNFVQSSVGTVELIDSVDFMAMRTEVLKEIDALNDELVDMLTSGVASPDAMKTTSENALLALAERVEIIDALKASAADDADESEGDDDDGDVGEAEVEPEVVEDLAPTLAEAAVFGQEAMDEIQKRMADLMELNFDQVDPHAPKIADSINWMAMRTGLIKDLKALQKGLATSLTSGSGGAEAMMKMSKDALLLLADRVEIIDAVTLTMTGEMPSGGTQAVLPDSADDVPPKPTRAEVAKAGQALIDLFDKISDRGIELGFVPYAVGEVRIFDGIDFMEMKTTADEKLDKLMDMVTAAIQDPNVDMDEVMAEIEEMDAFADDMVEFMDTMEGTIKTADAPTDTETEETELAVVVATSEALLKRMQEIEDLLLETHWKPHNADSVDLTDGVNWMKMKRELSDLSVEVRNEVSGLLHGPNKDLEKAMLILEAQVSKLDNYEDLVKTVGETGISSRDDDSEIRTPVAEPEVAKPSTEDYTTRAEMSLVAQELIDLGFDLSKFADQMLHVPSDPYNPQLSDNANWSRYYNKATALIEDIRKLLPPILAGDGDAGGMTPEQFIAANDLIAEKKEELTALSNEMNAWIAKPVLEVDNGRIWGDPHFVGEDGGMYDVQGEAGSIYNILSDNGLQVNARFDEFGSAGSGMTVMGAIGITLGDDLVEVSKDGTVRINGELVPAGTYLDGKITVSSTGVKVAEEEFSFEIVFQKHPAGDHLNMENIRSENAAADGVLPSGLWGGTVDYDDDARNGDAGSGTQGGGAIENPDGTITESGDLTTVNDYVVSGLFDTDFDEHNKFS